MDDARPRRRRRATAGARGARRRGAGLCAHSPDVRARFAWLSLASRRGRRPRRCAPRAAPIRRRPTRWRCRPARWRSRAEAGRASLLLRRQPDLRAERRGRPSARLRVLRASGAWRGGRRRRDSSAATSPDGRVAALAELGRGVAVAGQVADLEAAYARADVAVVPLERGSGRRIKLLEAIASGVPSSRRRSELLGSGPTTAPPPVDRGGRPRLAAATARGGGGRGAGDRARARRDARWWRARFSPRSWAGSSGGDARARAGVQATRPVATRLSKAGRRLVERRLVQTKRSATSPAIARESRVPSQSRRSRRGLVEVMDRVGRHHVHDEAVLGLVHVEPADGQWLSRRIEHGRRV